MPPISHVTKVFAAKDAKVYPLTTDPAGGSATYGTGVDIPGLKKVEITGDINSAELRGDNALMDVQSAIGSIKVSVEFAKLSLDILAAFFGNLVTDSGTTPNQKSTWNLLGTSNLAYIGMTAQAVGADVVTGDVQFALPKLMLTSFPELGLEEEDYKTSKVEFAAVPRLADGKWLTAVLNETAAAVAAPA